MSTINDAIIKLTGLAQLTRSSAEAEQIDTLATNAAAELAASRLLLADAAEALKPFAKAHEARNSGRRFYRHLITDEQLRRAAEVLRRLEAAEKL